MRIEYELTVDDLARWVRFSFLSQRAFLFFFAIVMVSALGAADAILAAIRESRGLDVLKGLFFPIIFSGIFAYTVLASGYHARRTLKNQPSLRGPIQTEFTDTGFLQTGQTGSGENRWSAINEVVETKSLFVLKMGPQVGNILPKRAFTNSQLDEFRALLERSGKAPRAAGFAGRWS